MGANRFGWLISWGGLLTIVPGELILLVRSLVAEVIELGIALIELFGLLTAAICPNCSALLLTASMEFLRLLERVAGMGWQ